MDLRQKLPNSCIDCDSKEKGIFCDLQSEELLEISKHKVSNHYKKGQTLFLQGNPTYGLFCISKGKVKVLQMGADGRESLIRVASNGDVVGHRSLFTEEYYSTTASVIEDSVICFLDKRYIIKAIQEKPSVSFHIIEKFSKDLGAAENKMSSMFQKNVRERLAELLLLLKESYGVKEGRKYRLEIKLTRDEMASMIGTANETLIRFMSELKSEGIIEQEGKILYVCKEGELVKLANLSY
jgi:CRP-like cAMP-binding protein